MNNKLEIFGLATWSNVWDDVATPVRSVVELSVHDVVRDAIYVEVRNAINDIDSAIKEELYGQ